MTDDAERTAHFNRFVLIRTIDVTGISGTGKIAVGIQWPDGSCHLHWLKEKTYGYYRSLAQLERIHCYKDNAVIEWLDQRTLFGTADELW